MISLYEFLMLSLLFMGALGITWLLCRVMKGKGFKVKYALNLSVIGVLTIALALIGGLSLWTVKGIVFALILMYISVQDYTNREADDFLWVMILLLTLCNASNLTPLGMLFGGLITFIPTMAIVLLGKNAIFGGADIKVSAACGLMLGFTGGAIGYCIGLLFAILFNLIYNKVKQRSNKRTFPMLPFLSVGFMIGYFI